MRVAVAPFFVPSSQVAVHSGWAVGEAATPLPKLIEAWDYQSELRLSAGLSVDIESLRAQAFLGGRSRLQVLVGARSSSTKIERCVLKLDLPDLEHYDLALDLRLQGSWLGGRLTIETTIVALECEPLAKGAATSPGSILWTTRHDTVLEGHGGLFPTDVENFQSTRPDHADAPWVLAVQTDDLDALFAASVRLSLNTALPGVEKMLSRPDKDESIALARLLELDVTRQLVGIALSSEEVLARPIDPEATALGDVLRLLVSRVWPRASTTTLRGWRDSSPERIELDIHQFVKAFR